MLLDIANRALEDARKNRDRFDMASWVSDGIYGGLVKQEGETVPPCGTTACFGGFAIFQAAPPGTVITALDVTTPDGKSRDTFAAARDALGLTSRQAEIVFYLADLAEVEDAVGIIAQDDGISGPDLCVKLGLDPEDYDL